MLRFRIWRLSTIKWQFELNLMVNIIYLAFVPFSILSSFIIDRFGLYMSVVVAVVGCALGAWLRYAGVFYYSGNFWVALVGQGLIGIAQPFMGMNTITLLATNWFGEKERTIAATIAGLFNVIGAGIAYGVGPAVISTVFDIPALILGQAITSSVLAVGTLAIFRGRPPVPPSAAAAIGAQHEAA